MTTDDLLAALAAEPSESVLSQAAALMPDRIEQDRLGIRRIRAHGRDGRFVGVADWTQRRGTQFVAKSERAAMLGAAITALKEANYLGN